MKNKNVLVAVLLIAAVLVGVGTFLKVGKVSVTKKEAVMEQPAEKTPVLEGQVEIKNMAFSPAEIRVKAGTKVVWMNSDSTPHSISGVMFSSPKLSQGQKFEMVFNDKGTSDYTCGIHPSMRGKVIVE